MLILLYFCFCCQKTHTVIYVTLLVPNQSLLLPKLPPSGFIVVYKSQNTLNYTVGINGVTQCMSSSEMFMLLLLILLVADQLQLVN